MTQNKIITQKEKGADRHWKNYLDKNYLGSHNLEDGEDMLLTIASFVGEEEVQSVDGSKKQKPVLYFTENVPKMILNITNGDMLSKLYGSHPEKWIGKQIRIFKTPVKAFGKTQDALRIRDIVPKIEVDVEKHKKDLGEAKTLDELKKLWIKLPASARNNEEVEKEKDIVKEKLVDKKIEESELLLEDHYFAKIALNNEDEEGFSNWLVETPKEKLLEIIDKK